MRIDWTTIKYQIEICRNRDFEFANIIDPFRLVNFSRAAIQRGGAVKPFGDNMRRMMISS